MQRLRASLMRCLIPARSSNYMPMWPRPDMTPKPDDKEGLPARKGDETYGLVTRDEVETRLLYCLKNYPFIDIKTLDLNKDFTELGLDSLEVISTITSIEHEFNYLFPDNEFDNFKNFNEIAEVLTLRPNLI